MKIAYLICAHTDCTQLNRLIKALTYHQQTGFFVHLDQKSTIPPKDVQAPQNALELNVSKLININWGGYSQCEAILVLIKRAMESKKEYDRFVYISGLDYPIWPNSQILSYFKEHRNKECIMALNLSELKEPRKMPERIKAYHFFRDSKIGNPQLKHLLCGGMRRITRLFFFKHRNHFNGMPVYEGSSWWALSRECLQYVLDYYRINGKQIRTYFKYTFAPDEMMLHTLVFNSPFGKNALLYTEKNYPGLVGLTPLHYIEYNGGISVYKEKDYDKLLISEKMFCRKVETGVSDELMNKIDLYRNE